MMMLSIFQREKEWENGDGKAVFANVSHHGFYSRWMLSTSPASE
jgi:hypothetical protein